MTRKEAEELVQRLAAQEIELVRSKHFWDETTDEGFRIQDVLWILKSRTGVTAPQYDEAHGNYKVEVVGEDMDGRRAKVVLGLRSDGLCIGITIHGL